MSTKEILHIGGVDYVHIKHAAHLLGVSQVTVRAACRDGSVVGIQAGGAWYVQKSALKLFLKRIQDKGAIKGAQVKVERVVYRRAIEQKSKNAKRLFKVGGEIRRKK